MTRELEALRDWLKAAGMTHVGRESTGVDWRPVYTVLEGHFELIVGNARHIPGRHHRNCSLRWYWRRDLIEPSQRSIGEAANLGPYSDPDG